MTIRPDVIETLATAAQQAILDASGQTNASVDEVISTYFTLVRRAISGSLDLSNNKAKTVEALRQSLYTILADLVDDKLN